MGEVEPDFTGITVPTFGHRRRLLREPGRPRAPRVSGSIVADLSHEWKHVEVPTGFFLGFADQLGLLVFPDLGGADRPALLTVSWTRLLRVAVLFQEAPDIVGCASSRISWLQGECFFDNDDPPVNQVGFIRLFPALVQP